MFTRDVFRPGHNCWRVARVERVAFLVDGEEYFRAFHAAGRIMSGLSGFCASDLSRSLPAVRGRPRLGAPAQCAGAPRREREQARAPGIGSSARHGDC